MGPVCLSLGVEFLNKDLGMTVDDYKVERLLCLLNTEWSRGRRRFQALPAAVLIGNVFPVTLTCAWLRWSLHQLIGAMKDLIKRNYHRLARTLHFAELFAKKNEQWLDPKAKSFTRRLCPNTSIYKTVWQCQFDHWLTLPIHKELDYLQAQCIEHLNGTKQWIKPLSHFVDQAPDASIQQDASTSWEMGGGSGQLQYWWQVCWKTWNPEIHRQINDLPKEHPDKLWINKLEFAAIVVNNFAASTAPKNHHMQFNWQPLLHMGGDNKSENCWATIFFNSNKFA